MEPTLEVCLNTVKGFLFRLCYDTVFPPTLKMSQNLSSPTTPVSQSRRSTPELNRKDNWFHGVLNRLRQIQISIILSYLNLFIIQPKHSTFSLGKSSFLLAFFLIVLADISFCLFLVVGVLNKLNYLPRPGPGPTLSSISPQDCNLCFS